MKTLAAVSWFGVLALVGSAARGQNAAAVAGPPVMPGAAAPAVPGVAPAGAPGVPPPRNAEEAAARALNPPPPVEKVEPAQPTGETAEEKAEDRAEEQAEEARPPAPQVIEEEASGRDDNPYAADIDNDVAYDDSVAQGYDDGYDPQAYRQFEQTLAPYGSWVDDESYGRVWQPSQGVVGNDFSPYATNGDWAMTEYGWTWVSAWDWGWAPFHFGRWARMSNRGWCWVPGTIWSPAQVAWRAGAGFVGWAPLAPRHVTIGAPFSPRSPWRFASTSSLGRARGPFLTAHSVPRIFGRMSVVSNGRSLAFGGATVRVNAGPVWVGHPPGTSPAAGVAPVRMAVAAPRALPRIAIQPHAGTPLLTRPWMQPAARFGYTGGVQPGAPAMTRTMPGTMMTGPMTGARSFAGARVAGTPLGYIGGRGAGYAPGRVYGRSTVVMPQLRSAPAARGGFSSFAGGRPAFGGSSFRGAPPAAMRSPGGGGRGFSAPSFSHAAPAFHGAPGRSFGGGGGFGGRHR